MQQLDYVRQLLTWAVYWFVFFLLWFEVVTRLSARAYHRRRR
jgi:hypothetical protein